MISSGCITLTIILLLPSYFERKSFLESHPKRLSESHDQRSDRPSCPDSDEAALIQSKESLVLYDLIHPIKHISVSEDRLALSSSLSQSPLVNLHSDFS